MMLQQITLPPSLAHSGSLESLEMLATVSVRDQAGSRRRLRVDMPKSPAMSVAGTSLSGSTIGSPVAEYALPSEYVHDWVYKNRSTCTPQSRRPSSTNSQTHPLHRTSPTPSRWPSVPFSDNVSYASSLCSHPTGLDAPQVGIDFVLGLEHVCLRHMSNPSKARSPGGHTLTAHAPLLLHGPKNLKTNTKWQVPVSEIERLLRSNSGFTSCGELTPVQAWSRLKSHPAFQDWDREDLENFQQNLMPEVRCHGFGAVIDENRFEKLMQAAFKSSQRG